MKTLRSLRRLGASMAAIAILFTQIAVSAYACPDMKARASMQAAHAPDCKQMPSVPTNLCHQSCVDDPLSHHTADVPSLAPAPDTGIRAAHVFAHRPAGSAALEAPLERATAPPLAITLVRFLK
jgi:hypothetical protein